MFGQVLKHFQQKALILLITPNSFSSFVGLYMWYFMFKITGSVFMYSAGTIQILCVTDVEMMKEISQSTSLNLGKPSYLSRDHGPLLGQGIFSSNGPYWAHQRKTIAPEFYLNKVKVNIHSQIYALVEI